MKAVVHRRYGSPDVLRIEDVPRPEPRANEVLVRVRSSSVTRSDCGVRNNEYWFARVFTGLIRPRRPVAGMEFAGVVEEVGADVTGFVTGDEVFGIKGGSNAEYVCVAEDGVIAHKPSSLTFEEAGAITDGALSALTMLPALGALEGRHVAIYGASGSIGTGCVQVAKHLGARVTAVTETRHLELVRSLGADEVADYLQEDWTRRGPFDGVLDAVGKSSFRRARRALKSGGVYASADLGYLWHLPLLALATRRFGDQRAKVAIAHYRRADLLRLVELVDAGAYRPVLDRAYAFEDVVEATRYVESGQKLGNVALRVG